MAAAPRPVIDEPDDGPLPAAAGGSTATSRMAAIGGTLAALRAGNTAEATLTPRPAITEMMTVLLRDDDAAGREVDARCPSSSAFSPAATPMPAARPSDRGDQPDDDGLEQHRAEHLAAAGADGPHQGHLLGALGDEDREGVVDDERADEQGDDGEDQQEGVEEAHVLLDVGLLLLGDLGAGQHLDVRRARPAAMRLTSSVSLTPSLGDDLDGVDLARARSGRPGRPSAVNIVNDAPPGLSLVAERGDADDVDLLRAGLGEDRDGVAHDEVARCRRCPCR